MESASRRTAWPALIAPAMLTVVALTQWYHVGAQRLTPWKGGGFGMFSTTDSRHTRAVRCFLARYQGDEIEQLQIEVPAEWWRQLDELAYMPTEERAGRLARVLAAGDWAERGPRPAPAADWQAVDSAVDLVPPAAWARGLASTRRFGQGVSIDFDMVIVEVWSASFDRASHRMVARKRVEVMSPRVPTG